MFTPSHPPLHTCTQTCSQRSHRPTHLHHTHTPIHRLAHSHAHRPVVSLLVTVSFPFQTFFFCLNGSRLLMHTCTHAPDTRSPALTHSCTRTRTCPHTATRLHPHMVICTHARTRLPACTHTCTHTPARPHTHQVWPRHQAPTHSHSGLSGQRRRASVLRSMRSCGVWASILRPIACEIITRRGDKPYFSKAAALTNGRDKGI